ncbi:SDR family oxidoreductase [Luteipulveratus halotolerans]|uniref:Short-chain dehydrogenase n=1 Tax=Luteipulveratus halotolerans TaxID=1631356 RepID=A0A0L6CF22_9MICO|nr:SDR family oxidoreductase [Luteipulveratus halotolerans]KNX36446.1 short-chain dehydrogenase [Luteipulveratus halotolerans]
MTDSAARPVVLVTGATRGIGKAVCDALAPDHELIVGGRDRAAVEQVCAAYEHARPFVVDLADEQSTTDAVAALALDRLDGVVHSAGMLGNGALTEVSRADWRATFELNVFAVADLTRLLLPSLQAAQGTVVVINSGSGLNAHGPGGIYSASKFAVRAFTDSLREEVRADGVRVSSVHPGRVSTDMQRELNAFEGRDYDEASYLRPESVATAVRSVLTATPDATYETISIRPGPAATNRRA